MATQARGESATLSDRLLHEPYRFDFFQAVRLLERIAREWAAADPRRPCQPVGRDSLPAKEAVRFRALPSLAFPSSPVAQVRSSPPLRAAAGSAAVELPMEVVVTFLGLLGANGVMPHHYTALVLRRIREKDTSLRDFLDLFQHRLVSLFYRSWEKYRLPFAYERFQADRKPEAVARDAPQPEAVAPALRGGGARKRDDPVSWGLYCFVGLGTDGLRGRLKIPDEAFLYYSGLFAHQPRNPSSLEEMLRDYFGVPIDVLPLQGQWLLLGVEDTSRMAGQGGRGGRNNRVGVNLIVGRRVWEVQSKFRLRVGPLTYAEFRQLMPSGDGLRPLCEMTRMYAGPELDFDVQPVLKAPEVPRCQLSSRGERSRLGWNTWVHARPMSRDADDAVFKLEEL